MSHQPKREWVERWRLALKLGSWPKLLVPFVLGQLLGAKEASALHVGALLIGLAFTIGDLAYIVLLNDWSDQRVDELKRRMFPHGGGAKTIFDRILSAKQVLWAGLGAGAFSLGVLGLGGLLLAEMGEPRPHLFWLGALGLGVFWAYSLAPLRLNYRGGGELCEALGVGLLLPLLNFYLQSGKLYSSELYWLLPFMGLSLASALASGLSDEESDRAGGKRTAVVLWGNAQARRFIELSLFCSSLGWALGGVWLPGAWLPGLVGFGLVLWALARMRRASAAAITNAFSAISIYKSYLHRGIWLGALTLALLRWLI